MSGYQESMTDPSFARQLIAFTYPHIGNYGVTPEDLAQSYGAGYVGIAVALMGRNHPVGVVLARILEHESGSNRQVLDGRGNQDLRGAGQRGHAGAQVNRHARGFLADPEDRRYDVAFPGVTLSRLEPFCGQLSRRERDRSDIDHTVVR